MAEDLTDYLTEHGVKVRYLHSDIDTLERIEIIRDLRLGVFDVLVGINLLREGLDIPECALVAILDADKEGFLRSQTSLIQTIGRAARNVDGRVVLYADTMTRSLRSRDRGDRAAAQQAALVERGARHHADVDQADDRQGAGERVRAGLRDGGAGEGQRRDGVRRARPEGDDRRVGKAHARRGGGSWNSRRRRGCATKCAGWRRWTWGWSRRRRRARRCGRTRRVHGDGRIARRSQWGRAAEDTTRRSDAAGVEGCGGGGRKTQAE